MEIDLTFLGKLTVTIPPFTGSESRSWISKRQKIWLQIRIQGRNHNTSVGVTIPLFTGSDSSSWNKYEKMWYHKWNIIEIDINRLWKRAVCLLADSECKILRSLLATEPNSSILKPRYKGMWTMWHRPSRIIWHQAHFRLASDRSLKVS